MPFIAIAPLSPPESLVYGYQPGDPVGDDVVEAWELGEDKVQWVEPEEVGSLEVVPVSPESAGPARPGPEANRAELESYAVRVGAMTAEEAAVASQDDLESVEPQEQADDGRPAESAVKADWIAYVVQTGADESWANDKATTKADLMAWEPSGAARPAAGDTIAVALTEQQAEGNH
jgi:hypothetical protein